MFKNDNNNLSEKKKKISKDKKFLGEQETNIKDNNKS
jgi:hypothetical protein